MVRRLMLSLIVLAAWAMGAPAQTPAPDALQQLFMIPLTGQYQASLAEAKLNLMRVTEPPAAPDVWDLNADNKNLVWSGEPGKSQVLMTTFTKAAFYSNYRPGQTFNAGADLWLVPAPEMKAEVLAWSPELAAANPRLATEMYLGLPPDSARPNDSVVSLWINPALLVRPAMDTRVEAHEFITSFPVTGQTLPAPFTLVTPGESPGGTYPAAPNFTVWFVQRESVIFDTPGGSYPWTGLGYTYNWGSTNPVGGSEFVLPKGSPVTFKEAAPITSFYK
jgi:hypothetical protein